MKKRATRATKVLVLLIGAGCWNAGCTVESFSSASSAIEPEYTNISESFSYTLNGNGEKTGGIKTLVYEVDECADLTKIYEMAVEHSDAVGSDGFVPSGQSSSDSYSSPTRTANDVVLPYEGLMVKAGDLTVGWSQGGEEMDGAMVGPSKTKWFGASPANDEIPTAIAWGLGLATQTPPAPFWTVYAGGTYWTNCGAPPGKVRVTFEEDFSVTADTVAARELIVDRHKDNFDFRGVVERGLDNLPGCAGSSSPAAGTGSTSTSSTSTGSGGSGGCGGA